MYLAVLVAVAFFTRATARRIAGALAGGAAFGVVALGIIALGEEVGRWHMAITWEPYFVTLLLVGDRQTGYIVVPNGDALRAELETRCRETGREPSQRVRVFRMI